MIDPSKITEILNKHDISVEEMDDTDPSHAYWLTEEYGDIETGRGGRTILFSHPNKLPKHMSWVKELFLLKEQDGE